jgi:anti-sigma factor RsiW
MHLTEEQCFAYAHRTLSPAELLSVDDHLAVCAACCHQLSSVLQANRGENEAVNSIAWELTAATEEFHLSFAFLTAYVDQQLGAEEQEQVYSHLEVCSACRAEIEDLQAFKQTFPQPRAVPPPPVVTTGWRAAWQTLRPRAWWAWPAAAAVGVALLAFMLYDRREPELIVQQSPVAPAPVVTSSVAPIPVSTPSPAELSEEERAVQTALATGRLEIPADIQILRTKSSGLMGGKSGATDFAIIAPQGVIVESQQPRLQWTAVPGATQYVVIVTDAQFNPVRQSEALTATSWVVPAPLQRGAMYFWEVQAATADGQTLTAPAASAPDAKFKVLAPEALRLVRRARQRYATSPLELGVIYARVGLLAEAARELQQASEKSSVARRLLQSLQQQLG